MDISITISGDEMEWAKKGYIGYVWVLDDISILQQRLVDEGVVSMKIIPMGGERGFLEIQHLTNCSALSDNRKQETSR